MQINKLSLQGFRNYDAQALTFDGDCNVIYGENAQGKTNLLEAIVLLSCGKSPRAHGDKELIGFERDAAQVTGQILSRNREFEVALSLFRGKKRKMTRNGVALKSAGALSEVLQTVFFTPEDLYIIREGAAARRRFMDQALCQLRPRYGEALTEYSRLYEHKTRILRDAEEYPRLLDTLPEFNERLCRVGSVLIYYRARFCRALAEYAAAAHGECSGGAEALDLSYRTVSTLADPLADQGELLDALRAHQQSHYQAELASRAHIPAALGPALRVRTAALALKLAQREIHKNTFGEYPVMLLDDVLSELDPKRQEYVLNRIAGGQVFITCCENDRLSSLLKGKVFHIEKGKVL